MTGQIPHPRHMPKAVSARAGDRLRELLTSSSPCRRLRAVLTGQVAFIGLSGITRRGV